MITNPGPFEASVGASPLPLLYSLGALIFAAVAVLLVMRYVHGGNRRAWIINIAVTIVTVIGLVVSVGGMLQASDDYSTQTETQRSAYIEDVQAWLGAEFGIELDDPAVRGLINGESQRIDYLGEEATLRLDEIDGELELVAELDLILNR